MSRDTVVTATWTVLLVLGIRRWSGFYAIGASIKFAPALGIVCLVVRRRWREAAVAVGVGLGILIVSYALNPGAWAQFIDFTLSRGPLDESGFVAIPYAVRLVAGLVWPSWPACPCRRAWARRCSSWW